MVNLEILDKIEAFNGFDEDQLKHVQSYCKKTEFKQGERLFIEGDEAKMLWVVINGEVDMRFDMPGRPTSKENTITTISPYQVFGWSCFVPPHKYRLSAYCSCETCEVISIEKIRLERLFKKVDGSVSERHLFLPVELHRRVSSHDDHRHADGAFVGFQLA